LDDDFGHFGDLGPAMLFFFHVRNGAGLVRDMEGTELPDMEAARHEAQASARDFAIDDLRSGMPIAGRNIEIADDEGHILDTMPMRAVTG
jgi:hypothetical protein